MINPRNQIIQSFTDATKYLPMLSSGLFEEVRHVTHSGDMKELSTHCRDGVKMALWRVRTHSTVRRASTEGHCGGWANSNEFCMPTLAREL